MATIKINLDRESYRRLMRLAIEERRPEKVTSRRPGRWLEIFRRSSLRHLMSSVVKMF